MTLTRTETDADAFARSWIDAWNAHDVDAILRHYRDDVEYFSPFVEQLQGQPSLYGSWELRAYIVAGLERFPDLHLGPMVTVAVGTQSITMVYWSVNNLLAVETLVFDDTGLVVQAHCQYRADVKNAP